MKTGYILFRTENLHPGREPIQKYWFSYADLDELFERARLAAKDVERSQKTKIVNVEIFP